jgi:hypothetical protein
MAVPGAVAARFPLPALLSQALVAFTIEYDNEFEHQMPHRTARRPAAHSRRGPWLVSLPMWSNFMQFVAKAGVPLLVAGIGAVPRRVARAQALSHPDHGHGP